MKPFEKQDALRRSSTLAPEFSSVVQAPAAQGARKEFDPRHPPPPKGALLLEELTQKESASLIDVPTTSAHTSRASISVV